MKIYCEASYDVTEGDYRRADGDPVMVPCVTVTCGKCHHSEMSYGEGEESVRRSCKMLHENCPDGESNFYVIGQRPSATQVKYLESGEHILEIETAKMVTTKAGHQAVKATLRVRKSDRLVPGETVQHYFNIQKTTGALASFRQFVAAATQVSEAAINEAAAEKAVGARQPLSRKVVRCEWAGSNPTFSGLSPEDGGAPK